MRITSRNITIDQIFSGIGGADDGESIEIDMSGNTINVRLIGLSGKLADHFFTPAQFRQLVSAMNAADQELIKIEQARQRTPMPVLDNTDAR